METSDDQVFVKSDGACDEKKAMAGTSLALRELNLKRGHAPMGEILSRDRVGQRERNAG